MSKESCVTLFPEIETVTRKLNNEQFGILIRPVIAYRFRGVLYEGETEVEAIQTMLKRREQKK